MTLSGGTTTLWEISLMNPISISCNKGGTSRKLRSSETGNSCGLYHVPELVVRYVVGKTNPNGRRLMGVSKFLSSKMAADALDRSSSGIETFQKQNLERSIVSLEPGPRSNCGSQLRVIYSG